MKGVYYWVKKAEFGKIQSETILQKVGLSGAAVRKIFMPELITIEDVIIRLKMIMQTDKTPPYDYGKNKSCRTRHGVAPRPGQKWLTPYEIADNLIVEIEAKTQQPCEKCKWFEFKHHDSWPCNNCRVDNFEKSENRTTK